MFTNLKKRYHNENKNYEPRLYGKFYEEEPKKKINIEIELRVSKNLQLNYLDISHCDIDEFRFSILCERLQKLKMINAINPGQKVTGKCLNKLGPKIEDLWIGLNHLVNPNPALKSLVEGNGKFLLHLGLIVKCFQKTNFNLITENMLSLKSLKLIFGSNGNGTLKNIGKLKELECLVISENSQNENASILTDDSLLPVIKGCNKLKTLALCGTRKNTCRFTNIFISMLSVYCPKLEQIRFLNCNNVNNESLLALSNLNYTRRLHLFSIARIEDNGLINFVEKTKHTIRCLFVSNCTNVTEKILEIFIKVALLRPSEEINLYLDICNKSRKLIDLPNNLKFEYTK